jgi:peptidyl-prolyl cis-trans isomerase D
MMQFFRSIAKPLILVTAIAFFIWLVVDLSGLSGGGGLLTTTSVGKVNGTSVDLRTFQAAVQQATQERQSRTGSSMGLEEQAEVRDQVWEQTIQEIIFRAEYDRYGIRASDEEIASAIRSSPPQDLMAYSMFQTDGKFDPEKYQAWLASAEGQSVVPLLEQRYRDQILRGKLFQRVIADVTISDAALWQRYRDEKEMVRVGIVIIDPRLAIGDSGIRVTPQEVEKYYQDHKKDFERKPEAFVSYLSIPREPNPADTSAARERAAKLRAEILAGAPFAEVARRESADTISGKDGGELGEMPLSRVDSAFAAAVRALPLGTTSEPVLSQFGFHLIQVESRKDDTFKARHILIPVEVTGAHRDALDQRADTLERLASERLEPTALDTAAAAMKLRMGKAGPLTQGLIISLPEVGSVPDVSVWAFQANEGEQSPVIEAQRSYVVFRLDSLHEGGIPQLPAIRGEVEDRVRLEKKIEAARRLGENLATRARETSNAASPTLWQMVGQPGLSYKAEGPFSRLSAPFQDPGLVGSAFGGVPGSITGPIASDDNRVYLFQILERVAADSAEFSKSLAEVRSQALQAARQSRVQAYLAALRSGARIVDRRAEIFRTNAQTAAAQPLPLPPGS